jgi:Fe-S cluster assembly protein SufD
MKEEFMETTVVVQSKKEKYLADFEKSAEQNSGQSGYLDSQREIALKAFTELDFPTKRDENWKYTNIGPVFNTHFEKSGEVEINGFEGCKLPSEESITLVFVNGNFSSKLSVNPVKGLMIKSLSEAVKDHPELIEKYLGSQSDLKTDIFPSMNGMFFNDGAFVYIPEGIVLEKPIQLIYISASGAVPTVSYPRNLFIAGKNSGFKVVESYQSAPATGKSLVNSQTEIVVEENASVEYYKLQLESSTTCHIDTVQALQHSNSKLSVLTVTFGGSLVRNKLGVRLEGTDCETHMRGLAILKESQHVDNHTYIDHAMPNCYSNELYKNIVDGKSHAVFSGKIIVRKDAQKTNAFQSCKNILLSENASADAMPQLEIFADDVKCSHGSTTGRLNEEALFYLRSRGIGEERARALLIYAFAGELIESVGIPSLKKMLEDLLAENLGTEL